VLLLVTGTSRRRRRRRHHLLLLLLTAAAAAAAAVEAECLPLPLLVLVLPLPLGVNRFGVGVKHIGVVNELVEPAAKRVVLAVLQLVRVLGLGLGRGCKRWLWQLRFGHWCWGCPLPPLSRGGNRRWRWRTVVLVEIGCGPRRRH
jgi:hypothetical protein